MRREKECDFIKCESLAYCELGGFIELRGHQELARVNELPSERRSQCCNESLCFSWSHVVSQWALTLKLSRIAARSRAHGKLFLPCGWRDRKSTRLNSSH